MPNDLLHFVYWTTIVMIAYVWLMLPDDDGDTT